MSSSTKPSTDSRVRAPRPARRLGYVLAISVNVALLIIINVAPGWQEWSFLTPDTDQVVPIVNLSLVVGALINLVFILADPPPVKALGDLITTVISFLVMLRLWQVFPFDFSGYSFDWEPLVRIALVVGLFGTGVGAIVALVRLVRLAVTRSNN